jgi:hypothetical protein
LKYKEKEPLAAGRSAARAALLARKAATIAEY